MILANLYGHLYLSMEFVDGEDLASLLARIGRLPTAKANELAAGMCAGLTAAHRKGLLHRDLKPANIMIDGRGLPRLMDFGLAASAGRVALNEVRQGTPAYMAPEQLAGREVTVQSDLYALGLILYELYTGKRPFEASSLAQLLAVRERNAAPEPSTLCPDLDTSNRKNHPRVSVTGSARRPRVRGRHRPPGFRTRTRCPRYSPPATLRLPTSLPHPATPPLSVRVSHGDGPPPRSHRCSPPASSLRASHAEIRSRSAA